MSEPTGNEVAIQTIHEGKLNKPSWTVWLLEHESRAVLVDIRTVQRSDRIRYSDHL